jgi:hypothetical protein
LYRHIYLLMSYISFNPVYHLTNGLDFWGGMNTPLLPQAQVARFAQEHHLQLSHYNQFISSLNLPCLRTPLFL